MEGGSDCWEKSGRTNLTAGQGLGQHPGIEKGLRISEQQALEYQQG